MRNPTVLLLILLLYISIVEITAGRYDVPHPLITYLQRRRRAACVATCRGIPDGDYQSCSGCLFYATCSNGYIYDERPCAWFGGLYWDDDRKTCEWYSRTCNDFEQIPKPICVSSCIGVPNGDYQSCGGCNTYVTCSNGYTFDNRKCPWFLVWDDSRKTCNWQSTTCPEILVKKRKQTFFPRPNYFG